MKVARPVRFTYPIEEAEMFNIPEYKPPEEQPEQPLQPTAVEEKPRKRRVQQ
jgi:hypothetical protein